MTLLCRILVCLTLVLSCLPAAPVLAQPVEEATIPDYTTWEILATRAENLLAEGQASNATLETLRAALTEARTRFLSAQDINASRIATLQEQIDALGPVPDGGTEAEDIAARRTELNKQLAELRAPVLQAELAYRRADGLIREADKIIRDRQADELMSLGPTPLNPVLWGEGLSTLIETGRGIWEELRTNIQDPAHRMNMREDLPVTLFFIVLAGVLVSRGRGWMERVTSRILTRGKRRGRAVYGSLSSLGQIIVPVVGVLALTAAAKSTGIFGPQGTAVLNLLPLIGLVPFTARWLGGQVFPKTPVSKQVLIIPEDSIAKGRLYTTMTGVILSVGVVMDFLFKSYDYSESVRAVLSFPLIVSMALLLFLIGRLVRQHDRGKGSGESVVDGWAYGARLTEFVGRLGMLAAVAGAVLAAIGYRDAAVFFVFPSVLTLGLFALLLVLQRFVDDLYEFLTGTAGEGGAQRSLIPTLLGLGLAFLALPFLALIWGARIADLTELWSRFLSGFTIGGTRISPSDFLVFAVVFAIGYGLTRVVQGTLRNTVLPKTRIDRGGQSALISGVGYLGVILAVIVAITTAGIDLSSLAIVAGALSVGIGFGLQNIVSNFVSGIILLIERPVSQGDWIEVGGVMGTVKDISVRSTLIETFDRTNVIVPNSDLVSGHVTNWTHQSLMGRVIIPVGVAYGTDTRKVEKILMEIAQAQPLVVVDPAPSVLFISFGADALEFEIRVILSDVNYSLSVRSAINHEIARRFTEEGIEIPYAQRDIWLRNPDAVQTLVASCGDTAQDSSNALRRDEYHPEIEPSEDGDGDGR
ncbi:small-conductance mechanosensitive channel [Rhodovulum imhoffii]|uniref:Small-conductance mechanosensitive channel n=1 Tax=Rhodovulum imhoffii TaxID=365340 RepID=A0A2T5BVH5_9RHOB|nr:DUF3772 domain-containing protein [Rhodovulum imhoffii]PTN03579.1 small-conductance mechanosensitive channel [Rhodovulum imhoffii]